MQARHAVRVRFGDHIKLDEVQSMLSSLGGNVTSQPDGRTFIVEKTRDAQFAELKRVLAGWEQWGFVRWEELS